MSLDQRKRQRKRERKAAKRRSILAEKRKATQFTDASVRSQIELAAVSPVFQCFVPAALFEVGIGTVIFSRRMNNGMIAAIYFLVDVHCLGVKDVAIVILPRSEYELRRREISRRDPLVERSPAHVRKLVEAAVQFAASLGLSPHPDYGLARIIFGDVNAGDCGIEFEFGKEGKPFFVAGEYDSPAKCNRILSALREHLGDDFDLIMPVDPDDLEDLGLAVDLEQRGRLPRPGSDEA